MAKAHLLDRALSGLTVTNGKNQQDFWDSSFRSRGVQFGVRCYASGNKEYILRYRTADGRRPQMALGDVAVVKLKDARVAAAEMVGQIQSKLDPAKARDQYRETDTFGSLCDRFTSFIQSQLASGELRPRTADEYCRQIKVNFRPKLENRKLPDIARRDIIALLEEIEVGRGAPAEARRARALLHRMFSYALERDIVQTNPCINLPRLKRLQPRTRVLSDDEIKKVWSALDGYGVTVAGIFRLILLTGQRPGEVASATWTEIEGNEWHLPAERSKNRKPHIIPLSAQARRVLNDVRLDNAHLKFRSRKQGLGVKDYYDKFIFPSRLQGKPIRWLSKTCKKVVEDAKVAKFTPHDLRRTAATKMRQLKISREVVSKILNHTPQDVTSLHYDHYELLAERSEALQTWGNYIDTLVKSPVEALSRTAA